MLQLSVWCTIEQTMFSCCLDFPTEFSTVSVLCVFYFYFFNSNLYLFIYLFIFGCVGSSFLCEGFL